MQKVSYMGDGVNTEFTFNFPYFDNSNVVVTKNGVSATGYNIIGNSGGLDADYPFIGGTVVFDVAPTALDNITIARSLPLSRVVDYQPTVKINPTTLNQDMNYFMEVLKDLQDELESLSTQYSEIADKESTATLLARIAAIHDEIVAVSAQITAMGDVSEIRDNITTLDTRTTGLIDYVTAFQAPSAENNYTWYRKYKSGWVEQGGDFVSGGITVTLPVQMSNTHYTVTSTHKTSTSSYNVQWGFIGIDKTTTSITIQVNGTAQSWFVCGIAA